MSTVRRALLLLTFVAALAAASAAQATPDWTPPHDIAPSGQGWQYVSLGFADNGTELAAHVDVVTQSPFDSKLVVSQRHAVGGWTDEYTMNDAGGEPLFARIAVAPSGAAVAVWVELTDAANPQTSPARYRAAYRSPDGSWGAPVTLASPLPSPTQLWVVAAIAPDGTAAAGAVVEEQSAWGELESDTNAYVTVRPAGNGWQPAERITPSNVSAEGLELAFDDSDQLTATWRERYTEGASSSTSDDAWRIMTRRRSPSNGIWSNTDDLTSATGDVEWPRFGVGADGRAVVAWQWDKPDNTKDAWASTRAAAAAGWTSPVKIVHAYSSAAALAAGVAPDGTSYVGYAHNENGLNGVGLVRMPPGGAWSSPAPIHEGVNAGAGAMAFLGNDPVFAWNGGDDALNANVIEASRWQAGAPAPDAARRIEQPGAQGLEDIQNDRHGSVVAWWEQPSARFAVLDGGGPEQTSATVPATAVAGDALTASTSFVDTWSPLGGAPSWDFGDGSPAASGETITHTYTQAGTYTISVHSADAFANGTTKMYTIDVSAPASPAPTPPAAPGTRDAVKPVVSLTTPRCKPHETKRACAARRARRSAWSVLHGSVRDSAPSSGIARVGVAITQLKGGKAIGPVRFRPASVKGTAWSRKAGRLRRGTYVFRVRAVDKAGNKSATVSRKIRLV